MQRREKSATSYFKVEKGDYWVARYGDINRVSAT